MPPEIVFLLNDILSLSNNQIKITVPVSIIDLCYTPSIAYHFLKK